MGLTVEKLAEAERITRFEDPGFFSHRITLRISNLVDKSIEFVACSPDTLRDDLLRAMRTVGINNGNAVAMTAHGAQRLADLEARRRTLPSIIDRWAASGFTDEQIHTMREKRIREWDMHEWTIRTEDKRAQTGGSRWHLHVKPRGNTSAGWANIVGYPAGLSVIRTTWDWVALWNAICATAENDERLAAFAHFTSVRSQG